MKKIYFVILHIIGLIVFLQACSKFEPKAQADDTLLDGPVEGLNFEQSQQFLAGDKIFNDEVFTAEKGLGPVFVATSCVSCHAGDGKGHPFSTLTRFGQTDDSGNKFLHMGGPQLQNRAIPGFKPESLPGGATFTKLTPPSNTGLGFLDLVSDADILAMAAANLYNTDGVRGHPNWNTIPAYLKLKPGAIEQNGKYICRFGKKASVYDLLQQTADAFAQDIGITSAFNPVDVYSGRETDPEISNQAINNVVFYLQTLKAPIQRTQGNAQVIAGKQVFMQLGCASCHKPTLKTGVSPVTALSMQEFHPYTDLLVHDMGPVLDDGYTEGSAKTAEWRTPALWGLGLSPASQGGQYFLMHDGRATSIEQAITLHGGEALTARNRFTAITETDKKALIRFLESL